MLKKAKRFEYLKKKNYIVTTFKPKLPYNKPINIEQMKKLLSTCLIIAFVMIIANSYASNAPIKYGKVSMEELEMTTYELDSTAPAVVLCDYGVWSLQDYMFKKIMRIKILTKEGLEYANQVYPSDDGTTIRGKTFNLVNGEIQVDKLKSESIFKERIYEDYFNYRIAMPNVKVGSVIDIEITHFGIPAVWYFQKLIPVKWSELIIPQSMYIDYRKHFFGYQPLSLNTSEHWIAKDVPAFKSEPFINSAENYITKFEFDILSYHFPGFYKEYTTDWNAVARRLEESSYFGSVLNVALYLGSTAKTIEEADSTQLGRMKLAFEEAKKVKWNEELNFLSSHSNLSIAYKDQIGNSADINLNLINLLRKLKIEADPVVLSTRANGILPFMFPSFNKLNYVIVSAKVNGTTYLLDATDEYSPIGLLPVRCLNGKGQLMREDKSTSVSLDTDKKELITEVYSLTLNDDLTLSGKVESQLKDYGAYNFRHYYKSFNSEDEMLDDFMENNKGISISDYKVNNLELLEEPIKETYQITCKDQIYSIDNKYYFTPLMHLKTDENPFKAEERKYPVNFPYCTQKKYVMQVDLPQNYSISSLPKPLKMLLPNNGGSVLYVVQNVGNKLSVIYQFNINKTDFTYDEYQYLREFYAQLIAKQAEPVILTKNE